MKTKTIIYPPTRGGLQPVETGQYPSDVDGLTVEYLTKSILIIPKSHSGATGDKIVVEYDEIFRKADGSEFKRINKQYATEDNGETAKYELYEDTKFNQVDIDNPAYDIQYTGRVIDPDTDEVLIEGVVVGISYIDGQIEEEDPDTGEMIMVDNVINVEPLYKKGEINPETKVVMNEAYEPLADWEAMMGGAIRTAVVAQLEARSEFV